MNQKTTLLNSALIFLATSGITTCACAVILSPLFVKAELESKNFFFFFLVSLRQAPRLSPQLKAPSPLSLSLHTDTSRIAAISDACRARARARARPARRGRRARE
jgi:hypothetical protein